MTVEMYQVTVPSKICFGVGCLNNLEAEVFRAGAKRALIVTDPGVEKAGLVEPVIEQINRAKVPVDVFADSEPEPTIPRINDIAGSYTGGDYGIIIGLGGGSGIDTAKGLSVLLAHGGRIEEYMGNEKIPGPGIPLITIPTTAGTGSEITKYAIYGDPEKGLKLGLISTYILARTALVDPTFTYSCPPRVTAAAGIDALVHAIECYTARTAHNISDALAVKAIGIITANLATAVNNGADKQARNNMSEGALIAGIAFGNSSVAAIHALAYPLGSRFHVPHGVANGLLLPYVSEANLPANYPKYAEIARLLGANTQGLNEKEAAEQGVKIMKQLVADIGLPTRLRDLNVPEDALEGMAVATMDITRLLEVNPKHFTLDEVRQIWRNAW
jgi:alcohol dehydrogenase class IV